MSDTIKLITSNIKKRRQEKGLTFQKLGEKMGLTHTRTRAIENASNLNISTLERFAKALDVDIVYFFTKHEDF